MTQQQYKSKQEVFDKVWKHFIVDKNPQSQITHPDNTQTCIYGGTGCAIGCLIEDKEFCKKLDQWDAQGAPVGSVVVKYQKEFDEIFDSTNIDIQFLSDLQCAHDIYTPRDKDSFHYQIQRDLEKIAKHYSLEIPK